MFALIVVLFLLANMNVVGIVQIAQHKGTQIVKDATANIKRIHMNVAAMIVLL